MSKLRTKFEHICFEKSDERMWEVRGFDQKDPTHHGPILGYLEWVSDYFGVGTWVYTAATRTGFLTLHDLYCLASFMNQLEFPK
jgi:hypothetical protein